MSSHDVHRSPIVKAVEAFIFNVKWTLIPFYVGLSVGLVLYFYTFMKYMWHVICQADTATTEDMMLLILETVDIVMVANLVKMIIAGSYNSFVSKLHGFTNENISSGMLKVKMSTSIIGVSSIHLLKTFVAEHYDWETIKKQLFIHAIFLVGALILQVIEFIHIKTEAIEHEIENKSAH